MTTHFLSVEEMFILFESYDSLLIVIGEEKTVSVGIVFYIYP